MSRRALWASLLAAVLGASALLGFNLAMGNSPVLGLDLQGGVSVILAPTESAGGDDLLVVRDLIREELERLGIAEPDVRVESANIVVDLPGVRDQREAVDAVDVAGIVTLRPVLQCFNAGPVGDDAPVTTGPDTTGPDTTLPETVVPDTGPETTDVGPTGFRRGAPDETVPDETVPDETVPDETVPDETVPDQTVPDQTVPDQTVPVTVDPSDPAAPSVEDVLLVRDTGESCVVGAVGGTGEVFERGSAEVTLDPQEGWGVAVGLRSDGVPVWNLLASQCFQGSTSCPSRRLAIVLDDVIQSAPTVTAPDFPGSVSISGSFTEGEARTLSRVLNRGAFPIDVEAQSVETVSPALGNDTLRAAIVAGLIGGLAIMALMVLYYRKLAAIAIAGLVVWAMAMYSAAIFVSEATNYALSLAGATGIIVAIGIAVDSYVVMFERFRDEVRGGRSARNAAPRAFQRSWRTIVSANIMSLLASLILFWLSVGSVKGFALYLGLTTVCNLIVYGLFAKPALILLSRTRWLDADRRGDTSAAEIGATT